MPKPRLRRWHFDLALIAGLSLLAFGYWHIIPRPRWQSRIPAEAVMGMNVNNLGFSADSQFYYTIKDTVIAGTRLPKPIIQKWEVRSGVLLEEYPLQMPAEDVAYLKPSSPGSVFFCMQAHKLANQDFVYTTQYTNYQQHEQSYRLYDIATGQCLTTQTQLILKTHLWYLLKNPADGHHWGCYTTSNDADKPVQIVDLVTGKTVHVITPEQGTKLGSAQCSLDQHHILVLWSGASMEDQKTARSHLSIYRVGTWERVHHVALPVQPFSSTMQVIQDTRDSFTVKHMVREKDVQLLASRYVLNRQSNEYKQVGQPVVDPWNVNDVTWNQTPFRIHRQTLSDNRQPPEPYFTINNLLQRIGISLWRPRTEQQFQVYDLQSGELSRQLTGITEVGNSHLVVSPTAQYLAGVKSNDEKSWIQNYTLVLYELPHHLWQPAMRWMMYLSWLLIVPWPFRYLIRSVEYGERLATP